MSIPEYYYICFCPCHCYQVDNNVCDASVIIELLIAYVSLKCPIFHIIFFFFFFYKSPYTSLGKKPGRVKERQEMKLLEGPITSFYLFCLCESWVSRSETLLGSDLSQSTVGRGLIFNFWVPFTFTGLWPPSRYWVICFDKPWFHPHNSPMVHRKWTASPVVTQLLCEGSRSA